MFLGYQTFTSRCPDATALNPNPLRPPTIPLHKKKRKTTQAENKQLLGPWEGHGTQSSCCNFCPFPNDQQKLHSKPYIINISPSLPPVTISLSIRLSFVFSIPYPKPPYRKSIVLSIFFSIPSPTFFCYATPLNSK